MNTDQGVSKEDIEAKIAASNPLAKIPALFSAHLPKEKVFFTIGDCEEESWAELRPMNADLLSQYRDAMSSFSTDENSLSSRFYFEPKTSIADLALLLGTVVDMQCVYMKPGKTDKDPATQETLKFPKNANGREELFRSMVPELRSLLVSQCKTVNGLHPLSQE